MIIAYLAFLIAIIAAIAAGLLGWVFNILTLVSMIGQDITAELILRIVGVPIPIIGAVLGWM